jgi:recombinational DNA repair protein (RecF pathway)
MVRACLDAAAEAPSGLLSIGVYFELWLLRLAGYLPDWKKCAQCKREFAANSTAKVGSNFYLYCVTCRQPRDDVSADAELRDQFAAALRLSPAEFVKFAAADQRRLDELSSFLKRIISQSAGKDVFAGKLSMPSHSGLN